MTTAPGTGGSITITFSRRPAGLRSDQVHPAPRVTSDIARAIDELLAGPPPPCDSATLAPHTRALEAVAAEAGMAMLEVLTHARLAAGGGRRLNADDAVVDAMGGAAVALHRALVRYLQTTGYRDGWKVALNAMTVESGFGVAALVKTVVEKLRDRLLEDMRRL